MSIIEIIKAELEQAKSDKEFAFQNQNALEAIEAEYVEKALLTLIIKAEECGHNFGLTDQNIVQLVQ